MNERIEMAHVFVDDGYPEAREYDNNYIAFDPANSADHRRALVEACAWRRRRGAGPVRCGVWTSAEYDAAGGEAGC